MNARYTHFAFIYFFHIIFHLNKCQLIGKLEHRRSVDIYFDSYFIVVYFRTSAIRIKMYNYKLYACSIAYEFFME